VYITAFTLDSSVGFSSAWRVMPSIVARVDEYQHTTM